MCWDCSIYIPWRIPISWVSSWAIWQYGKKLLNVFFFHFLVVSLLLLALITGSDTARGERTATCLPVFISNGKRHGSRAACLPVVACHRSRCAPPQFPTWPPVASVKNKNGEWEPGCPSPCKSRWDRTCGDLTIWPEKSNGTWTRHGENSDL